jgi:hypothetical protein
MQCTGQRLLQDAFKYHMSSFSVMEVGISVSIILYGTHRISFLWSLNIRFLSVRYWKAGFTAVCNFSPQHLLNYFPVHTAACVYIVTPSEYIRGSAGNGRTTDTQVHLNVPSCISSLYALVIVRVARTVFLRAMNSTIVSLTVCA